MKITDLHEDYGEPGPTQPSFRSGRDPKVLEVSLPDSDSFGGPKFGRDPKVLETTAGATGSGSIATVSSPIGNTITRNSSIYGKTPKGSMLKGIKTSKKYANSAHVNESVDAQSMRMHDFVEKIDRLHDLMQYYLKTNNEQKYQEIKQKYLALEKVARQGLVREEDNLANIDPPNRGEDEGEFVKHQLHTMIRVLTHLESKINDGEDLPEWVEMKISQAQNMVVDVMDYMISDKEIEVEKETGEEGYVSEQNVWEDIDVDIHVEESFDLQEDVIDEEVLAKKLEQKLNDLLKHNISKELSSKPKLKDISKKPVYTNTLENKPR